MLTIMVAGVPRTSQFPLTLMILRLWTVSRICPALLPLTGVHEKQEVDAFFEI
jgi:hypothetical protein